VRVARRRFAFVSVLLVLAVLAAIYGFWQAKVARDAQAEAEISRAQARNTSTQADVDIALVYHQWDDAVDPRTLAHLARALRTLPNAPLPRQYVVSLLRDRLWYLPVMVPLRHEGEVYDASLSADGARIVTACFDGTARIWDANTGKQVGEPLRHQAEEVYDASFSADGTRIVTACSDNTGRIWDAKTGRQVGEPLRHEAAVGAARFSADGAYIVTASDDKTARIWDANTGQHLFEPLHHKAAVNEASFSADGVCIITASDDNTARVWDVKTGKQVGEPLRHEAAVRAAGFIADGARILSLSDDNTARIWDVAVDLKAPLPDWVAELAEGLGGRRFDEQGAPVSPPPRANIMKLRERLLALKRGDFWSRLGRWFFTRGPERTISPDSNITVGELDRLQAEPPAKDEPEQAKTL
jgi:hypothetical protein